MKKHYTIVALMVSLCTMHMHPMETTYKYVEKAKKLYTYYRGTSSETMFSEHSNKDAIVSMVDFVQTGLHDIDTRVNPDEIKQIFDQDILNDLELVQGEWEDDEVDQKLQQLYKQAVLQITSLSDKKQLEALSKHLIILRTDIETHREGLPFLMHRIGNNVDIVMQNMRDSFKQLEDAAKQSGFTVYKAYDILGFDAKNRAQIQSEKIRTEYERLGKQYNGVQTPLGRAVRQAGYILQSPFGKQNYDAFLSDYLNPQQHNKSIQALVITDKMAALLKIDYAVFNTFITTSKSYIDELNKVVQKRLKEIS
jgi:hypothetical protein